MPELIRSVVSRARMYFRDRRRSPRLRMRVSFSLSVFRKPKTNGTIPRTPTLKGHMRDINLDGMALMLPQIHLDGRHLAADGQELQVTLELAGSLIPLVAVPKRYEKLDEAELGCNYLIGVKIVRIDDEDRYRLENFISRALRQKSANTEAEII